MMLPYMEARRNSIYDIKSSTEMYRAHPCNRGAKKCSIYKGAQITSIDGQASHTFFGAKELKKWALPCFLIARVADRTSK